LAFAWHDWQEDTSPGSDVNLVRGLLLVTCRSPVVPV